MDTKRKLVALNEGIAEIKRSMDESSNENTKQRLQSILDERMVSKRELEAKLSVEMREEVVAVDESDDVLLFRHLRRSQMSDGEKSRFIKKHGMEKYIGLRL